MAFNGTHKGPTGGFAHLLASISRALFAGLISSLIAAAYGLSFAALLHRATHPVYLRRQPISG
jgi:hypothetical protein